MSYCSQGKILIMKKVHADVGLYKEKNDFLSVGLCCLLYEDLIYVPELYHLDRLLKIRDIDIESIDFDCVSFFEHHTLLTSPYSIALVTGV